MLKTYQSLFNEIEFRDAVKAKKVCLFLGSGVAFNIGMPDWKGLANTITRFCLSQKIITRSEKLSLLTIDKPVKIISICINKIENANKQKAFNNLLKKLFYDKPRKEYKNSAVYRCLNKLYKERAVLILQTNYDVMIEKFQTKEEGLNRSFYTPFMNMESLPKEKMLDSIIYLHGRFSCDNSEKIKASYTNLILSKNQYNNVYVLEDRCEFQRQKKFIKDLLKEYYIVFLGYSLNDEEIMQIIANTPARENYKKMCVIVDNCKAKELENEFNEKYLMEASNFKINTYVYDTDIVGIEQGFKEVVESLCREILKIKNEKTSLLIYTNPEEVNFD